MSARPPAHQVQGRSRVAPVATGAALAALTLVLMAIALTALAAAQEPPAFWGPGKDGLIPHRQPMPAPASDVQAGRVRLRGQQAIHVYVAEPGRVEVKVSAETVGAYPDVTSVAVTAGPDGPVEGGEELTLAPGQSARFAFEAPSPGVWRLSVDTGRNAAVVEPEAVAWQIVGDAQGVIRSIYRAGPLYFYVPAGVTRFEVWAKAGSPHENLLLRVRRPDGSTYQERFVLGENAAVVRVDVPRGESGSAWSVEILPPPAGSLENAAIWFSPNLPGGVTPRVDQLLVPFVTLDRQAWREGFGTPQGGERFFFVRSTDSLPAARHLHVSLYSGDEADRGRLVASARLPVPPRPGSESAWDIGRPLASGVYNLVTEVLGEDGEVLLRWSQPVNVSAAPALFLGGYMPALTLSLADRGGDLPALNLIPQVDPPKERLELDVELAVVPLYAEPGGPEKVVLYKQSRPYPARRETLTPGAAQAADGLYTWQVTVRAPDGKGIDVYRRHFVRKGNVLFEEQASPVAPRPVTWLSPEDEERGWLVFTPPFTDGIPYGYRPDHADLLRRPTAVSAPGEFVPVTLGLLSLDGAEGLTVTISDLQGPDGAIIPADAVRKERVHYWAQRTSWRSGSFWIIPEMLIPLREPDVVDADRRQRGMPRPSPSFDLLPYQQGQIWLTIRVPEGIPAGSYTGKVTFADARGNTAVTELELEVLPFALAAPPDRHWGLYTDSRRWNSMSEERVAAEMLDYKEHGITSLMMYPLTNGSLAMEGGARSVTWDLDAFSRYVQLARQTGLDGPFVMSVQALHGRIAALTGAGLTDDRFAAAYREAIRGLIDRGEQDGWGEFVYHAVDEPSMPEAAQQTLWLLGLIKQENARTFTTANNVATINNIISPVLDVRTWAVSFFRSPSEIEQRWKEAEAAGADLWLYGSGSYTGQEGRMYPNRFLTGFFFYKTGTGGIWSWTFQREKEEPFDDFDGDRVNPREPKDAMITYPSAYTRTGSYATLQWEGIREGITDYRYLYTLAQRVSARGDEEPELRLAYESLIARIPDWTSEVNDPYVLEDLRREVIALLKAYSQ